MNDPQEKKKDYGIPRSFAFQEDDLDDIAGGVGDADSAATNGMSPQKGACLIGGWARDDCGTGLQATLCHAGGSPDEGCANGRVP